MHTSIVNNRSIVQCSSTCNVPRGQDSGAGAVHDNYLVSELMLSVHCRDMLWWTLFVHVGDWWIYMV